MKVLSPQECGLPPHLERWRPKQEEALDFLLRSQKRVKAISLPTGGGKSAVYMAYALLTKTPTCMVTNSRGLQDQLLREFQSVGLVDLRGRRNYSCGLHADDAYTCEEGYAARCPYKGTVNCPSSKAEMRAAISRLVVTNYDKWTAAKLNGTGLEHIKQVVFDEGHETHNALARAKQVELHAREVGQVLGLPFLPFPDADNMFYWRRWASEARDVSERLMLIAKRRLVDGGPSSWVKHYLHLKSLCRRLATLSTCTPEDWVVEEIRDGYQFDPVRPARYAESALLFRIPSIVVVSATLRPKSLALTGISRDIYDYREFNSDFDPRRCPIYYVPTQRVDIRAESLAPLWMLLDRVASKRRDRKGIVHTISFLRRGDVLTSSRFRESMIVNERGEAPGRMIDEFRRAGPGAILVTPSVSGGYDFKLKEAEWQFICKLPFPPPSKILKARTEDDREYPYWLTMNKFTQIAGRIMRVPEDQGETIFGDMHWDWFNKYHYLATKSFKARFKRVEVLPQPPPPLSM